MSFVVREKSFYKWFFSLFISIALQALISFVVNFADNIMIGMYAQSSMSGVSLVNQIQYLLMQISTGIASGVVVLSAQYWGKGEVEPIRRIIALGMKFALLTGAIFTIVTHFYPAQCLSLLTDEPEIIEQGVEYLTYISFTYLVFTFSNTLILSYRSVESTKIAPVAALCSLVVNVFLNYLLIFGNLGFPEMGAKGAGLATLTARLAELLIVVIYVRFVDKKLKIRFSSWLKPDWEYLWDYLRVSIPVVAACASWGVGTFLQASILGHVGASAVAANSIASTMFQTSTIFYRGTTGASSIIIGKTIGAGQTDKIRTYSRTIQLLFLGFGIVSALIIMLLRSFILDYYTLTSEARSLTRTFMLILAITVVGTSYEYPVVAGIIQSGGDTKYGLIVDTAFTFLFTLPLSYISAFVFRWPPEVTYLCLKLDQIAKCLPNGIKVNRYKWIRVLTREAKNSVPET